MKAIAFQALFAMSKFIKNKVKLTHGESLIPFHIFFQIPITKSVKYKKPMVSAKLHSASSYLLFYGRQP